MLFGDADDPLRALRWTLAELRRCLSDAVTFEGDPLICTIGVDVAVDVHTLVADQADPAELLGLEGELLEGLDLSSSPTLDSWLVVERHRLSAIREARLREAAVALLATGQARILTEYTGTVSARLTVDRAETLDLFQRDRQSLERALSQAGLDTSKTNLEFSLRQQNHNPFAGLMGDQRQNQSGYGNAPRFAVANDEAAMPAVTLYRGTASAGGVNIFA